MATLHAIRKPSGSFIASSLPWRFRIRGPRAQASLSPLRVRPGLVEPQHRQAHFEAGHLDAVIDPLELRRLRCNLRCFHTPTKLDESAMESDGGVMYHQNYWKQREIDLAGEHEKFLKQEAKHTIDEEYFAGALIKTFKQGSKTYKVETWRGGPRTSPTARAVRSVATTCGTRARGNRRLSLLVRFSPTFITVAPSWRLRLRLKLAVLP